MTGRPDVIVDVVFEEGLLFLSVANVGDRAALDVKTTFNRKLVGLGGQRTSPPRPLPQHQLPRAGQGDPDAAPTRRRPGSRATRARPG